MVARMNGYLPLMICLMIWFDQGPATQDIEGYTILINRKCSEVAYSGIGVTNISYLSSCGDACNGDDLCVAFVAVLSNKTSMVSCEMNTKCFAGSMKPSKGINTYVKNKKIPTGFTEFWPYTRTTTASTTTTTPNTAINTTVMANTTLSSVSAVTTTGTSIARGLNTDTLPPTTEALRTVSVGAETSERPERITQAADVTGMVVGITIAVTLAAIGIGFAVWRHRKNSRDMSTEQGDQPADQQSFGEMLDA